MILSFVMILFRVYTCIVYHMCGTDAFGSFFKTERDTKILNFLIMYHENSLCTTQKIIAPIYQPNFIWIPISVLSISVTLTLRYTEC
jgi:hypothetical protein